MFKKLRRVFDFIAKYLEIFVQNFCSILLTVMVITVFIGVFYRYVLKAPLSWTEEATRFMMAHLSLWGAALAIKREEHSSISFVVDKLPARVRNILDFVVIFILGYFSYFMVISGYRLASSTGSTGIFINIPMSIPMAAIPISGVLMLFFLFNQLISKVGDK